jgi:hypothetical protein
VDWNPLIFQLTREENEAFYKFKKASISQKPELRSTWKHSKNKLKNAVRNLEKNDLRKRIQRLESLRSQDPKEYWNGLYDLDDTYIFDAKVPVLVKDASNNLVGGAEAAQVWMNSFSKLGLEKTDFSDYDLDFYQQIKKAVSQYEIYSFDTKSDLDRPITLLEVQKVVSKLKKGKAVGIDGISNEILKYGGDKVIQYLWKLYDSIFTLEHFPIEWARGLIFPLFKGGPEDFKLDPNKYRGITLLSIVGKTYTAILNNRVSSYCENNGIIVDNQAGFRKERSTVDQLFILTEVIKYHRPRATYCAFIDISKAYDKIWRDGLWYKLWKCGIRGKMWRILKNIYKKVESSILLGDYRTAFFEIEVGLRQGCILSPLLFNLFINDLQEEIKKLGKGIKIGNFRVDMLYFADDIVLLAESREDLEKMLEIVYNYSLKWRLKFNYDKCNVIIFDNQYNKEIKYSTCTQNCTCGHHFSFGPNLIKEVLFYKYLGIELSNCLSFDIFKKRLLARARCNMARIWSMGIKNGNLSVKGSINIWQAIVRSTLEYGSVIWGKEKWLEGEQVQADMAKRILRCSSKTKREAMYGDLGWWPLQARRDLNKLKYWFHLITLDGDRLLKKIYIVTKRTAKPSSWAMSIKKILTKYQLGHLWNDEKLVYNLDNKNNLGATTILAHRKFFKRYSYKKVFDQVQEVWRSSINENIGNSKLRTYVTFKKNLRLEKYLLVDLSYVGRSYHTSLRSGSNLLEIDRGRLKGVHREIRFCMQCDAKVVETEKHFLVDCARYHELRQKFFLSIFNISNGVWDLARRPENECFILLIQGTGDQYENVIFKMFHKYLERCFSMRVEH